MQFWIDVEDSSGTKYGAGPITTATEWRDAPQLSRAGSFSFSMPLADPRAALIAKRRIVRCYAVVDGVITEQSAGVVENIKRVVNGNEPPMLQVSGGDLGRELTYRTMDNAAAGVYSYYSPAHVVYYSPSVTLTNAFDDDLDTYATVSAFASGQNIRIEFDDEPPAALQFFLSQGNAKTASNRNYRYYNGAFVLFSGVTDGTESGGAYFAQSGRVSWTMPGDWIAGGGSVGSRYCVLIQSTSTTFDAIRFDEIYGVQQGNTAVDLAAVMAKAPSPWALDTSTWYSTTTSGDLDLEFAQETVLAALVRVAERSGEHFRIGPGRYVQWMRTDTPDSGIRAIGPVASPLDAEDNDALMLIANVEEIEDAQDEITRIYPYGGGSGDSARVTLANTTESAPSGYTMDATANYIEVDGASPEIHRSVTFSDITAGGISAADKRIASNSLYTAALTYLQQHQSAKFYSMTVAKLHGSLRPGDQFHLRYRDVVDGIEILDIDADLVVLGLERTITAAGVRTVRITASTVTRQPESDEEYMARQVDELVTLKQHPQPIDTNLVY